jgi:hypothetical protein
MLRPTKLNAGEHFEDESLGERIILIMILRKFAYGS